MMESKDAVLVGTSLVLAVGTVVSVSIQVERQYKTVGRLNASKWFLVIGAFFALVMTSLVCAAAAKGLGAAISTEEFESRVTLQKLLVAAFPPYFLCNMFVKHAWLTFYYGLATTRAQRYFIHFMQFTAASFGISSVLVVVLQCIPLSYVWNRYHDPNAQAQCINVLAFFYANASIMIANDVVMYLIPIVLLRKVDTVKEHRWGLYALFGVGGLVVLASVFRLIAVHDLSEGNVSENYALVYLWAAVENHVGICAACAGAIKQKTISSIHTLQRSYSTLRQKSWSSPSSPSGHSQASENRTLYERTGSLPDASVAGSITKDTGIYLELSHVSNPPMRGLGY